MRWASRTRLGLLAVSIFASLIAGMTIGSPAMAAVGDPVISIPGGYPFGSSGNNPSPVTVSFATTVALAAEATPTTGTNGNYVRFGFASMTALVGGSRNTALSCAVGATCVGVTVSAVDSGGNPFSLTGAQLRAQMDGSTASGTVTLHTRGIAVPAGTVFKLVLDAGSVDLGTGASVQGVVRDGTSLVSTSSSYVNLNTTRKVIFDSNGGTGSMADQWSSPGGALSVSTLTPPSGRTFLGWSATSGASSATYLDGASNYGFTATNQTLYAVWGTATKTVTFNADFAGASPATATQTASAGSTAALNGTFTRAGYMLSGWSTSSGGATAYSPVQDFTFTADTSLFALWTANLNTVTYNSHGGSTASGGSTSFPTGGTVVTLPSAPTLAGYAFNGWFAAATGGSALANGYAPGGTSAIELHAQWTANSNAVTYNSHGGSTASGGSTSFPTGGTVATLPSAPTRTGYTFNGWFAAATGGSALANGYAPGGTSAVELHAQWTAVQASATVTFDANGGSGTLTAQISGSAAALTSNNGITRNGYYFNGWNTVAAGGGTAYADGANYAFSSSTTLYAQWRAIPATPTAAVAIQVPVGQPIANAPVALEADGLKVNTGYTVSVRSTPQIIEQGTIWSGRLSTTVRIPANLEAGWHRLIIEGTAADGTPWVETNYFQVSPTGVLEATSATDPAATLVNTGGSAPAVAPIATLIVLLGAAIVGMTAVVRRRRKN
jgi:uncharacterized repeat protein (TIGR02543 family)